MSYRSIFIYISDYFGIWRLPVAVSNSKLAITNPILAKKLDEHLKKATKLGVRAGRQRIELVCSQFDRIAPDVALELIDVDSLQGEIEEADLRKGGMLCTYAAKYLCPCTFDYT